MSLINKNHSKEISIKSKSAITPKNNTFILSSGSLHNELLAYVMEKEFGSKCSTIDNVNSLPAEVFLGLKEKLLLIDYSAQNYERMLADNTSNSQVNISSYILGLYNLPHNQGIEKRALLLGIKGFFYKEDSLKLFLKGIKSLFAGEVWIRRDILVECALEGEQRKIPSVQAINGLSQREMEVLALVSLGTKNEDIAEKLFISPHTVKTHLYHIFKKINVPNRLQAALWSAKNL